MARHDILPDPPAGFGFGFRETIAPPAPLIDTPGPFAVPPEGLLDWAADAAEGARCVYARAEHLIYHKRILAASQRLREAGTVTLERTRHAADSSLFDFIAKRTTLSFKPSPGGGSTPAASFQRRADPQASGADPALETIYRALRRAARSGERCPFDSALALEAGLATKHRAAWRVRQLEQMGRIGIETVTGPDGCAWRIAIVDGRRTAGPPKGGKA